LIRFFHRDGAIFRKKIVQTSPVVTAGSIVFIRRQGAQLFATDNDLTKVDLVVRLQFLVLASFNIPRLVLVAAHRPDSCVPQQGRYHGN
jgi:hypothetical protein